MGISTRFVEKESTLVIEITGAFNFAVHQAFRAAYQRTDIEVARYRIDLTETESLDSSALGMLLLLRDWSGGHDTAVALLNPSAEIEKVLRLAKFDKLFDIPSIRQARTFEQVTA